MRRLLAAVSSFVLLATLASPASAEALEDPIPDPVVVGDDAAVLDVVATGLTSPIAGVHVRAFPNVLYVADQTGVLHAIDLRTMERSVILDLSDRLTATFQSAPNSLPILHARGIRELRGGLVELFEGGFDRGFGHD